MIKTLTVACLVAAANGAKIFFAPGCNTNADQAGNFAGSPLHTSGPRPPSNVPRSVSLGSSPADVNFPSGSYAFGEMDMPDGFALTLPDGAELDVMESATGEPAVLVAGQQSRPECDMTCHTNYREGTTSDAQGDLSSLPVSSTPISVSDDLIFPSGYNYAVEAYGALVAAQSMMWKGNNVVGAWMPQCTEVSPCATDAVPLMSAFGSGATSAFQNLYGTSAATSFTSCPALPVADASDVSSLQLPQSELQQVDMRRVGVQTSAASRLAQLQGGALASMCSHSASVNCPSSTPTSVQAVIDVTGFRPRVDLSALTVEAQTTMLQAHIVTFLSSNLGEVSNFAISVATFGQGSSNQLRLTVTFNVAQGETAAMYQTILTQVVNELVGSFPTATLPAPCVSLAAGIDFACVTQHVQAAFATAYDGSNTMDQVRAAMTEAYGTSRGCTAGDVCDTATFTATLSFTETEYREALITSIIAGSTTAAPTVAIAAGQTAPPSRSPTSHAPTTHAPTSAAPVTVAPTTHAPVTHAPVPQSQVGAPTTFAPTTQAPVTVAPTTQAPTTKAPSTFAPTTLEPTAATVSDASSSDPVQDTVGIPLIYAIVILAVIVILIAAAVVMTKKKSPDGPVDNSNTMAFENPLYDDGGAARENPVAAEEDTYDDPQYAGDDDDDDEEDDAPQHQGDGGYLDVTNDDDDDEDDDE